MSSYHLIKGERGWFVKQTGSNGVVLESDTKRDALRQAMELVRRTHGELVIHHTASRIQHVATPATADQIRAFLKRAYSRDFRKRVPHRVGPDLTA